MRLSAFRCSCLPLSPPKVGHQLGKLRFYPQPSAESTLLHNVYLTVGRVPTLAAVGGRQSTEHVRTVGRPLRADWRLSRNKIGVGVSSAIDVSGRLPPLDWVTNE